MRIAVVDLESGAGLVEAFTDVDAVVEVISNDQRPSGIQKIIASCEQQSLKTNVFSLRRGRAIVSALRFSGRQLSRDDAEHKLVETCNQSSHECTRHLVQQRNSHSFSDCTPSNE